MRREFIGLIVAVLIVLGLVGGFISYNYWPILTGQKIVLDTRPVDPFDPFRGQYMTIGYEISWIDNVTGFEQGDNIYVSLDEDDEGVWRYEGTSKSKPKGDFIKGEVERAYDNRVSVRYGVEQFFFERNAKVPTENITVEVAVASSGRAKFVQMLQNGKPIEIEYGDFDIRR
jgi:uncharacterized membrane-anchored protein